MSGFMSGTVVACTLIQCFLGASLAISQPIELVRSQVWGADEEHPPFAQMAALIAAPNGDAWVLEATSGQLYQLKPDGSVVGPVGRKGDAPGEWNLPTALLWLPPYGPVVLGVMPTVLAAPLAETNLALPSEEPMGMTFPGQAKAHDGRVFMEWNEIAMTAMPPVVYRALLSFVPGEDAESTVYRRQELEIDLSDPMAFSQQIVPWHWAVLADGRVISLGAGPHLQLAVLAEDSSEMLFLDEEVERQEWPESYKEGTMAALGSAGLSSDDLEAMLGEQMKFMPPALQLFAYEDGMLLLDARDYVTPPEGVDLKLRRFDVGLAEVGAIELIFPDGKLGVSDVLFPAEGGWWLIENQSEKYEGVVVSFLVQR